MSVAAETVKYVKFGVATAIVDHGLPGAGGSGGGGRRVDGAWAGLAMGDDGGGWRVIGLDSGKGGGVRFGGLGLGWDGMERER